MDKSAVLIVGHGSREAVSNRQFKRLVKQFAVAHPDLRVVHAFLELAQPSLSAALETLALSSKCIRVLPVFLFASGHMRRDIPRILKQFRLEHPWIRIKLARELGVDALMAQFVYERTRKLRGQPHQTWVLMVGRGAREKRVQNQFKRLVKLVGKNRGFQKIQDCSVDWSVPSFEQRLQTIKQVQPRTLWVVPYLLFPGKLMVKIRVRMRAFARENPSIQVQVGEPLGLHPLLLQLLHRRLTEG